MATFQEFCGVVVYEETSENRRHFLFYSADIDGQLRGYLVLPFALRLQTGNWYRIRYQGNEKLACFYNRPMPINYISSCSVIEPPPYRDAVFRFFPNSKLNVQNGIITMIVRASVRVHPNKSVDGNYIKWFRDSRRVLEDIVGPGLEAEGIPQAQVALEVYARSDGWHIVRFLGIGDGDALHNFLPSCAFPFRINGNYSYSVEDFNGWIASGCQPAHNSDLCSKMEEKSIPRNSNPVNVQTSQSAAVNASNGDVLLVPTSSNSLVMTPTENYSGEAPVPKVIPATVAKSQHKGESVVTSQSVQSKRAQDINQERRKAPVAPKTSIGEPSIAVSQKPKAPIKDMTEKRESEFPAVFERTVRLSTRSRSLVKPPSFSRINPSGEDGIDIAAMIVLVQKKYVVAWTPQPECDCNSILIEMEHITDSPFEKKTNGLITEGLWLTVKAVPRLKKDADMEKQPFITHIASDLARPPKKNFPPWEQRIIAGRVELLADFDTTDSNNLVLKTDVNGENVYIMKSTSRPAYLKVIAPYKRMIEFIDVQTGASKYKMKFWCTVKQYRPDCDSSLYLLESTPIELSCEQNITVRPGRIAESYCLPHEKKQSSFFSDCIGGQSDTISCSQVPKHIAFSQADDTANSLNSSQSSDAVLNSNGLASVLKGLHSPRLQNIINEEDLTDAWNQVVSITKKFDGN